MGEHQQRPPIFASAEIRVRRVEAGLTYAAEISVCGVTVVVSEMEARALCTALRDALGATPVGLSTVQR